MNTAAPQRVIDLAGAFNCRDMGGYAARNGRRVKWGQLYRSGTLHAMTPQDLDLMRATGLRTVCDFRSNRERHHQPNRLNGVPDIEYWFRDHDKLPGDLSRMWSRADVNAEHARDLMMSLYRDLPYEFADAYREVFAKLINGETPLLFNCTAGKDRTGVAAALLLTALGVPSDLVMEDYLLTERFFEQNFELTLSSSHARRFAHLEREVWEPLVHAEARYLDAMFDQLRTQHGSVDHYLSEKLDVDAPKLERLRANLLETV